MMKLLSINLARTGWFFNFFDYNPRGKSIHSGMISLLRDYYKFKKTPPDDATLEAGLTFETGEFIEGKDNIAIRLTIQKDAVTADTRFSTTAADNFLKDLFSKLSAEYGLPNPEEVIKGKGYLSNVYISTDVSLDLINPKLKPVSKFLSDNVQSGSNRFDFEVGSIGFWPNPIYPVVIPTSFTIERQMGVPFAEKRYFSTAPLETDKHLQLLEKTEKILSK